MAGPVRSASITPFHTNLKTSIDCFYQAAANHFRGALTRWPKSILRPEIQLQDVLAKRLEKGPLAPATGGMTQEQADLKQANALYSLLEDRYKNKVGGASEAWGMALSL
jgi:hypothetical protein